MIKFPNFRSVEEKLYNRLMKRNSPVGAVVQKLSESLDSCVHELHDNDLLIQKLTHDLRAAEFKNRQYINQIGYCYGRIGLLEGKYEKRPISIFDQRP